MPVASPSLTSGTITIGRPSRRPRATSSSRSLATRCLRAPQLGRAVGAAGQVAGDAAPVDHRGGGRALGPDPALDAVAGEADDLGDGRADVGQRAQRAVRELVAVGARAHHLAHERHLEQGLVAAGDADRDGLGLVLDGVDRPGQLLDGLGERRGEVVDHHGRRADLALVDLVGVERDDAEHVAEQRGQAHRGGRLELAVVPAHPQAVEVRGPSPRGRAQPRSSASPSTGSTSVSSAAPGARRARRAPGRCRRRRGDQALDRGAGLAQGPGQGVDRQRRLVAEQVADHGRQHERQLGVGLGHREHVRAPRRSAPGRRWRSRSATPCAPGRSPPPWPRRRRSSPTRPAAQTRISGSEDRSMCFLSSVESLAIDL